MTTATNATTSTLWHQKITLSPLPGAEQAFDAAIEALIHEFGAEEIWVYGSCARGNPTRHSDVDFMIVRDGRPGVTHPSAEALKAIRPHHRIPIGIFVITPERWAQRQKNPQGVYIDIVLMAGGFMRGDMTNLI